MDFPWNKPSSSWGVPPMTMETPSHEQHACAAKPPLPTALMKLISAPASWGGVDHGPPITPCRWGIWRVNPHQYVAFPVDPLTIHQSCWKKRIVTIYSWGKYVSCPGVLEHWQPQLSDPYHLRFSVGSGEISWHIMTSHDISQNDCTAKLQAAWMCSSQGKRLKLGDYCTHDRKQCNIPNGGCVSYRVVVL